MKESTSARKNNRANRTEYSECGPPLSRFLLSWITTQAHATQQLMQQSTQQSVIVLFTRYPQAGKVKTRLIKRLGPQGAADLHSRMT
ncbi:MAG: hypothetical protein D3903_21405, partial [Candidatus Electrothrix sp. GM3_4]|nr:hypothetical protein [Candidatus Electrothrix sp. GM3_4]